MTPALPSDQLVGSAVSSFAARLRENLRFDGLWWRKLAALGCGYGPEWVKRYLPAPTAAIIFLLVRRNRRGAIANMARIVGATRHTEAAFAALRMYVEFAHCMTETMEYYGPSPPPIQVDLPERDTVADALREGRGAVIVTGHFGNWDIAAKILHEHGRPINVVMARELNATTDQYVRAARERAGVRVIYSDTSVLCSLNMIRALRRNEVVAIQLDRSLGAVGARLVPFFGAPASFPSGPFILARAARAPLIPVFTPRLGPRHYAIRVGDRFNVPRETRALDRVMGEVVHLFEDAVRAFPTQWFQFAPFWPGGAAEQRDDSADARGTRTHTPILMTAPRQSAADNDENQFDQLGGA
jgi:lauroyl/myristoyl acyltransferase